MKPTTTLQSNMFGLGAFALILSLVMSGLMIAPTNASAFWWPWGDYHHKAHAQGHGNGDDDDDYVTVTIKKYIDGEMATTDSADGNSFPVTSTWDDPEDGAGSNSFELSSDNSYKATSSVLREGSDFSISEVLDGDVVAASCEDDTPYKLVGYTTGTSLSAAASTDATSTAPALTDLSSDMYIIVWNETCEDDDTPSSGSISGEVTGGQTDEEPGELAVTSIDAQKTTAVANGEFVDGWQYVFNITVPADEPNLAMKFADWMQTDGDHTLPVANNMRISSEQASATSSILLTGADVYSSPDLTMTGDLDADQEGLQVQVLVEVAVPADTYNGTYSTNYSVRTLP